MADVRQNTRVFQVLGGAIVVLALATISWEIYSSVTGAASSEALEGRPATIPSANTSNNPLDAIDRLNPPLPELVAWRKSWEAGLATSRSSSFGEIQNLNDFIEATDLKAAEQLSIGQYVLAKGDRKVAAVWFRRGINQTEVEWNSAKKQHPEDSDQDLAELVVRPLLDKGMDDAGRLLWEPQFEDGKVEEKITKMELALDRDNEWDQRPEWTAVGYGEALVDQSRFDEALVQANKCVADQKINSHWTDDQKTELRWLQAFSYLGLKQDGKAVPHLEAVANTYSFGHCKQAARMLILAYCRLGRSTDAQTRYQDFISRYNLDSAASSNLQSMMESSKPKQSQDGA